VTFLALAQADGRPAKLHASKLRFDGFKLGDNYGVVMQRVPYNAPCDNDPIDKRSRRFMVYGALPCRDRTFPEQTTVIFYLAYSDAAKYEQPIQAFAYLHGRYFDKKTNFPLKPGDALSSAPRYLGSVERTMTIRRKSWTLAAQRYRSQIHVLANGEKIVGFVFGPMPDDPQNEQWRGLMQMYQRYTPK
jgi:hypothetical protein